MNLVIAATAFGLLWLVNKQRWSGSWVFVVVGFLALVGGSFLVDTMVGGWVIAIVSRFAGFVGGLIGTSGGVVLGAVVLIGTVWAAWALLKDRTADKPELTWLIVLPILFVAAAGPIADGGQDVTTSVREAGQSSIGNLIGG